MSNATATGTIAPIPNKLYRHPSPTAPRIMIKHSPSNSSYRDLGKNIPSFRAVHRHACLFISHQRKRPRHRKRPHNRANETLDDDASRSRRPAAPPSLSRSEMPCVSGDCDGQYDRKRGSLSPRPEARGPSLAAAGDEVQVDKAGGGATKVSHSIGISKKKKIVHCRNKEADGVTNHQQAENTEERRCSPRGEQGEDDEDEDDGEVPCYWLLLQHLNRELGISTE